MATAKGKKTTKGLAVGDRVLINQDGTGGWQPAVRRTGQTIATVAEKRPGQMYPGEAAPEGKVNWPHDSNYRPPSVVFSNGAVVFTPAHQTWITEFNPARNVHAPDVAVIAELKEKDAEVAAWEPPARREATVLLNPSPGPMCGHYDLEGTESVYCELRGRFKVRPVDGRGQPQDRCAFHIAGYLSAELSGVKP